MRMRTAPGTDCYRQQLLITIIIPPIGVFILTDGCGVEFWINVILTICGWFPGALAGLYCFWRTNQDKINA